MAVLIESTDLKRSERISTKRRVIIFYFVFVWQILHRINQAHLSKRPKYRIWQYDQSLRIEHLS